MMVNDDASGYMGSMDIGFGGGGKVLSNSGFADITELYVSNSGHARLFTATRYGKKYILKCLKEDYLYVPTYRTALAKEFEIGLQLDHDNVRRTVGMETIQGLGDVIIMEYVDGCTLKSLIDNGRLTKPLARKVASQLASALDYMHGKQIVHRDLKPSNIMLTYNGMNVKLIDFSLSDSDAFNILKNPAGTSGYIAPEQFNPEAKADAKADVYSFGKVLMDMANITGDKLMKRAAVACARRNAAERPDSVAAVISGQGNSSKQRITLIVMVCIAVLLCAVVAVMVYNRALSADGKENNTFVPDGNQAVDYNLWKDNSMIDAVPE